MNIAKTIMSAAPARKRSAKDTHFVRERREADHERAERHLHRDRDGAAALDVPEAGRAERADDGPEAEDREEVAQHLHVPPEDVLREDGKERQERKRAEASDEREADETAQRAVAVRGLQARLQVLEDAPARGPRRSAALEEEERDDDREEREAVEAEARRGSERRERGAREDGPDRRGRG